MYLCSLLGVFLYKYPPITRPSYNKEIFACA